MASRRCDREREIREAVASGRWSAGCDAELHAHAAECTACAEVAVVATAICEDRLAAMHAAPVPRPGLVWWRMQLRAQRETEASATRAMSRAHVTVVASTLAAAVMFLGSSWLGEAVASLATWAGAAGAGALQASWRLPLLIALAAWVALAPVSVWLAVTKD